MANKKSKHAFGSEANVDAALQSGAIGIFDILFLSEGKIGWIDKNGEKVILEDKEQVILVDGELPETGKNDVLYIHNNSVYLWNGEEFSTAGGSEGVTEEVFDQKLTEAADELKAYLDEQIASATDNEVVEF